MWSRTFVSSNVRMTPLPNILNWDIASHAVLQVEKIRLTRRRFYGRLCALLRQLRDTCTQLRSRGRWTVPASFVPADRGGERRLDVIELRHVAEALDTTLDVVAALLARPEVSCSRLQAYFPSRPAGGVESLDVACQHAV